MVGKSTLLAILFLALAACAVATSEAESQAEFAEDLVDDMELDQDEDEQEGGEEEEEQQPSDDDEEETTDDESESDDDTTADVDVAATAEDFDATKRKLERVLVTMYGVNPITLQEFADEVSSIESKLRAAYQSLKTKRDGLARELAAVRAKVDALKKEVISVSDRVRRLKRAAYADAKKRAERLREQLRARIRAHRAGLDFVRKLREQIGSLRTSVNAQFSKQVADIQTTMSTYADDLSTWTGEDVQTAVQENKNIGTGSHRNRLYTKKHLKDIADKMYTKLRSQYINAKEALKRANARIPDPHVGRLEELLNGLKARLSRLQAKSADIATALNDVENGYPSLSNLRGQFIRVKAIVDQIYTEKRVPIPKVHFKAPASCVKKVKKHYRHFNRCRKNLRKAVIKKAPRAQTYVLWKQYVYAKTALKKKVRGCAKGLEEMEELQAQE